MRILFGIIKFLFFLPFFFAWFIFTSSAIIDTFHILLFPETLSYTDILDIPFTVAVWLANLAGIIFWYITSTVKKRKKQNEKPS